VYLLSTVEPKLHTYALAETQLHLFRWQNAEQKCTRGWPTNDGLLVTVSFNSDPRYECDGDFRMDLLRSNAIVQ
jgi:hypothetical protein